MSLYKLVIIRVSDEYIYTNSFIIYVTPCEITGNVTKYCEQSIIGDDTDVEQKKKQFRLLVLIVIETIITSVSFFVFAFFNIADNFFGSKFQFLRDIYNREIYK